MPFPGSFQRVEIQFSGAHAGRAVAASRIRADGTGEGQLFENAIILKKTYRFCIFFVRL